MGKIKVLPETLISQIAAGEVVERPASVVKELIENSLDAGATECRIEIEQGGLKLISVRDNGSGMDSIDAASAFKRHATSKLATFDELFTIGSYGFRGEALAAIASVALVTLKTRQTESDRGYEVRIRGGQLESQSSIGTPQGTEIIVHNLFFNTPARKKFVKKETTEAAHIVAAVSHAALAHPRVGFLLISNGRTLINVAPNHTPQMRMAAVLGKSIAHEMIPVSFQTPSIHIHGFVSRPGREQSGKRHQYLFINNRDITDSLVAKAVSDAYHSRLPGRSFALFVLHIDIDPHEVDVNVHPRKLAVKFLEPQRIYRDVSQAVTQALREHERNIFELRTGDISEAPRDTGSKNDVTSYEPQALFAGEGDREHASLDKLSPHTILSQIADSYIVIAQDDGIAIIDQHAAHERITYERLKAQSQSREAHAQSLLTPLVIELSAHEMLFFKKASPILAMLGFQCDEWSSSTIVIQAIPSGFAMENIEKIFREFLEDIMREGATSGPKKADLPERILKSLACKASIKFGMHLSLPEQQKLLADLAVTPNSSTCPHGRPTKILMSFEELRRKFYRS